MGAKSAGATTVLRAHGVLSGILHRQRGEHLAAMGTVGEAPGSKFRRRNPGIAAYILRLE
jgi:hypothetical protein